MILFKPQKNREMKNKLYAKVVTLEGGYKKEQETIRTHHKIGDIFEVTYMEMGSWHTDVYEGDEYYNSVYFEFFADAECTQPIDIYEDPDFNPYKRVVIC